VCQLTTATRLAGQPGLGFARTWPGRATSVVGNTSRRGGLTELKRKAEGRGFFFGQLASNSDLQVIGKTLGARKRLGWNTMVSS